MKKLIFVLIFFIYLLSNKIANSQNLTFFDLPDIPVDYISLLTTSVYGDSILINGGEANIQNNPNFSYDYLLIFDVNAESWSTLTTSVPLSQNFQERSYENGEVIGDNLYIFNGWDLNNETKIINIQNGQVTFGNNNPVPRKSAGSAVLNNNIYTFGGLIDTNNEGQAESYTNSLYYYNVDFDSWTELAPMPEAKETRGEIIGNKLFVVGGYNGSVSNKIDVYNISTNEWENQYIMPFSVSANSLTVVGNNIFIIGDFTQLNRIAIFDTENEIFTNVSNNMIGRRHFDAEIINDKLYVIGGNYTTSASDGGWLNSIQYADVFDFLNTDVFDLKHNVNISPNPTYDSVRINSTKFRALKFKIIDEIGRVIKPKENLKSDAIDLKNYNQGIYYITIYFEKFSKTFKVIKL
jgi:hypothetical protein